MGYQDKIANQIVNAGADFAHSDPLVKTGSTFEIDHGRQERRNPAVADDVSWLVAPHPAWNTIKSIGPVESIRTTGETATTEQR
ncbi:MAG: hypothetical protein LBE17_06470 [Treponema sp.]|jgi:hypothetical protein|nr:hypothetical protein [Treponema sp.]